MSEVTPTPEVNASAPAPEATSQSTPAPEAAPAAPAPEVTAAPAAGAPAGAPVLDASGNPVPPAWQPNFKFKSYDKEYEIDEMYRALIKDADTEKKVKSLFEKAYAIDTMKPKYQRAQEENTRLRTDIDKEFKPLAAAVDELSELYARGAPSGELEPFFQKMKIPDEVLFKYVMRRLDYGQLTPEQKAIYDRNVQAQTGSYQMQQQNQALQEQLTEVQVQTRTMQMSSVLARPEVSQVQALFDSKLGAGAFQREVINAGVLAWNTEKKDLSAEDAVMAVVNRYKPILGDSQVQTTPGNPAPGAAAPTTANPTAGRPPVIPSVKGQGTSPVKKMPKNLQDLKNIAAQMNG